MQVLRAIITHIKPVTQVRACARAIAKRNGIKKEIRSNNKSQRVEKYRQRIQKSKNNRNETD